MKMWSFNCSAALLAVCVGAFALTDSAQAVTYSTSGAPTQTGLGWQTGYTPDNSYDKLTVKPLTNGILTTGQIKLNDVTFDVGYNAWTPWNPPGPFSFSETFTIDNDPNQSVVLTIPFTIQISYTDTLTIGVNSATFTVGNYSIAILPLQFLNQGIGAQTKELFAFIQENTGAVATPLPAALPLLASSLAGMGLIGWRRKRKAKLQAAQTH
jgi:hypothetical protein